MWTIGGDPADLNDLFVKSVAAMEGSPNIPLLMKSVPHARLVNSRVWTDPNYMDAKAEMARQIDLAIQHFNDGLGTGLVPAHEATAMAQDIIDIAKDNGGTTIDIFNRIYPGLETTYPNAAEPLVLKGKIYVEWAWQARGTGWSNTVTPQGWKDMADRLAAAALSKAYELNPDDPAAATEMLTVELGQGNGRDVMETWFQRAMRADPDNYDACAVKLEYLQPKRFGSPDEMLNFGRQCVKDGNWYGRIPFILIDAHKDLAQYSQSVSEYYHQPEVWPDIELVYESLLERYPHDYSGRSMYARWACTCGQWKEAVTLFDELGDHPDLSQFNGQANYDYLRRKAIKNATEEMK